MLTAHGDILRIIIVRWTWQPPINVHNLLLDTASLSILRYRHSLG